MKKIERKIYGHEEIKGEPQKYRTPKYDTDILDQNIIITGVSFLRERMDSHGTKSGVWLLTLFDAKNKRLQIASNHAYVKELIEHFTANPETPLHCRIITHGEAQAKRYKLAEPEEK